MTGAAGNDTLIGNDEANTFIGNNGDDSLVGGGGNDSLYGGFGFDTLNGGTGTDYSDYRFLSTVAISADLGQERVNFPGQSGFDVLISIEQLSGSQVGDTLVGSNANETLWGEGGNDNVNGGKGSDHLVGGADNDSLAGGDGPDTLWGDAGNDTLQGGDDALDELIGGDGFDIADYLTWTGTLQADLATGRAYWYGGTTQYVERLRFNGVDVLTSSITAYQPAVTAEPESGASGLVYRFFNTSTKAYFYTSSAAERDVVIRQSTEPAFEQRPGDGVWTFFYQGSSFEAAHSSTGSAPIYRFYNTSTGHHFFTVNEQERALVIQNSSPSVPLAQRWSFIDEGVLGQAFSGPEHTDAQPVYRFYNPGLDRHFFTGNADEAAQIKLVGGWNDEGIGFYGEAPG